MTIRTRFSPSPTGMIHLGNARAALFAALYAKKNHGVFLLRIEDSDVERSEERFVALLQDDLHWLDVHWQEGPGQDGPYAPYWQSQRQAVYDQYYERLSEQKLIYPCFCSDQELLLARKLQLSRSEAPRYSGRCRELSQEAVDALLAEGKKPAWRFRVPKDQTIAFDDVVKGPQSFQSNDIGDFIVRRADGTPPFLFCNAIDDATMAVTHVLRGEDHLANTPRQIMLLKQLGLHVPHYGHLSLIVGSDGAPLSKRHGSFSVHEMRAQGFLPLAMINYLARLGHGCDSQALLNFDGLAAHFHLDKLSRSPARFDVTQLLYWQKMAVQQLDEAGMWRWLGDSVQNQVPMAQQSLFVKTVQANIAFPEDALNWAKILFHDSVTIDPSDLAIIRDAGEQFFVEAEQAVQKYGTDMTQVFADMKQSLGVNGKKLFMPVRIALTGKAHGPELVQIAELLGPKKMQHRLGQAFKLTLHEGQ